MGRLCRIIGLFIGISVGAFLLFVGGVSQNPVLSTILGLYGTLSLIVDAVVIYTIGDIYEKVKQNQTHLYDIADEIKRPKYNELKESSVLGNGGWKCPNCGNLHYSYETTCSCGMIKP